MVDDVHASLPVLSIQQDDVYVSCAPYGVLHRLPPYSVQTVLLPPDLLPCFKAGPARARRWAGLPRVGHRGRARRFSSGSGY